MGLTGVPSLFNVFPSVPGGASRASVSRRRRREAIESDSRDLVAVIEQLLEEATGSLVADAHEGLALGGVRTDR